MVTVTCELTKEECEILRTNLPAAIDLTLRSAVHKMYVALGNAKDS